jgi:hypothetical protein
MPRVLLLRAWRWSYAVQDSVSQSSHSSPSCPATEGEKGSPYLGSLRLAGEFAELGAQDLLVFDIQVLVAEEDDATLGDCRAGRC